MMKKYLVVILGLSIVGSLMAYNGTPTEILKNNFKLFSPSEKDMYYHSTPSYYWAFSGTGWAIACWFKPADYNITMNFRIKTIGMMFYNKGTAKLYSQPNNGDPNWSKNKYGPQDISIDTIYPSYNDTNIYSYNWYYTITEINNSTYKSFWMIYAFSVAPYPISDGDDNKNSLTWNPQYQDWMNNIEGYKVDWCMHCVVEYPPTTIENTSVGTVKSLFK